MECETMKILLFANTDWYLYNFRLALAHSLQDEGAEVVMLSPPGEFGVRLEDAGFRWRKLPMKRRSLAPLAETKVLTSLTKILLQETPNVLHNFTIKPVVYGSLAARFAGVRNVLNAVTGLGHVFIDDSLKARTLRPVVNLLLRQALYTERGRLILQNQDDKALFVKNRLIKPNRIRVIRGSGVNTEQFQPNESRSVERVSVLLATRLLWEKGLQEFVEAAKDILAKGHDVHFLVAGEFDSGNPASVPLNKIQSWSGEKRIEFLGHVDDMVSLLKRVDMVVLPSYREGTPRILLEAGAAGLPLITTDVPGCREVVVNGENGILVPAKDSGALASAIISLLNDSARRLAMGRAARKKVMAEFDEKIVIDATIDVYEELVRLPRRNAIKHHKPI